MNEIEGAVSSERTAKCPPAAIKWVLLAFFCVATMVQFIVLPDFGPDEPHHVDYVYTLAVEKRLPTPQSDPVTPKPGENHLVQHPPLYYAALSVIWKLTGATQKPLSMQRGITSFDKFESNALLARRLMRLTSALLGCLTLWLIARTLALLKIPPRWQILLVAWAASWPMLQYVSGVVNNENLAYAFSALFCFVLIARWQANHCTLRQAFSIGLLCGAGILVKQSTLFALPLALWILWTIAKESRLQKMALFFGGALLTGIWWPLHNFLSFGEPFPTFTPSPTQPSLIDIFVHWKIFVAYWLRTLLESAFLPDWSLYFFPKTFETVIVLLIVAAFIALLIYGLRAPKNSRWRQLRALGFSGMVFMLLGVLQYCALKDQRAQIGGRYLLNALPWAMVFLAASLPLLNKQNANEEQNILPPSSLALLPLGFLLLIDGAWWFIVWTHYQTSIATELQRRLGG